MPVVPGHAEGRADVQLQAGPREGAEHGGAVPVPGVDRAAHALLRAVGDALPRRNERRALPKAVECL